MNHIYITIERQNDTHNKYVSKHQKYRICGFYCRLRVLKVKAYGKVIETTIL